MKIPLLTLSFVLFILLQNVNGQDSYSTAKWLSLDYATYTPQAGGIAQPGPDYGCVENLRRPFWFIVSTCGQEGNNSTNIEAYANNYPSNPNRTDSFALVLWGPFDDSTNVFNELTSDKLIACYSYWTTSWWDFLDIWFHPQLLPNKLYYGVITSSDSISGFNFHTWIDGMETIYTDSAHCTICHGRAAYMDQHICVVTVDSASGKNRIYWSPEDSSMAAYVVCRQSSILGQYDSIGLVEKDESLNFIDEASDPLVKSYSYLLATEDSCGRIHPSPSNFDHITMHLTTSVGLNGEVNLVWNQYSGILYSTYYIFRSVNNGAFAAMDSIASNTTTYTDLNPPAGELHYRVGIKPPSCYEGDENYVYSNRSSVGVVGISENFLPDGVNLFPNPVHTTATLKLAGLAEKVKSIHVVSTSGEIMMNVSKLSRTETSIDVHTLHSGIYILEMQTDEMIYRIRMAVQ